MNVLMFGWEFPPLNSGGLGTACYGLTKSLSKRGINITFVLPYSKDIDASFLRFVSPNIKIEKIDSVLMPYMTLDSYNELRDGLQSHSIYGPTLFEEVARYTEEAVKIARNERFDIVHCHDWMTFGAGIKAKEATGKPLVIHVHATEFDRTGGHGVNQYVYDAEKTGMLSADYVVAVSNLTKSKIVRHYGISPDKITVVHNAIDNDEKCNKLSCQTDRKQSPLNKHSKIVLFLGRITLQKGPDYFLYAAKKILDYDPDVRFIVAGSGDMERFIIEKSAELGIADKFLFAGFLRGEDIERAYRMADVYVMPSVSEPFGLTPLEAMRFNTPVIISKQSGVSEVINHCLKVDFWDVNELANKIIALMKYKPLYDTLRENASLEIKKFSWDEPARKCIEIYNKSLGVA